MLEPNIVIAGDSWGCGEWFVGAIQHKGLEQYFIDRGYNVVNLSKGNLSNKQSISRLYNYNLKPHDIVFWIMTQPIRDIRPYHKITEHVNRVFGLKALNRDLINQSLQELNQLNRKIYLIGGLYNIPIDISSQYNNLQSVVPSWINLLLKNFDEYTYTADNDFGVDTDGSVRRLRLDQLNKNIVDQVVDEFYQYHQNEKVFREEIFQPDGVHPNRHGHKILFEEIIKKCNL